MELVMMILLLGIAALSLIPVIKMSGVKEDFKYKCLRYLANATLFWTVLIFLERIVNDMQVVYYIHMLGYPIKFLLSAFVICTILDYIEIKMPKWAVVLIGIGFLGELFMAGINQYRPMLLDIDVSTITSLEALYNAPKGWFFIVHLLVIYLMLIVPIVYLFYYFYKHREKRHYGAISTMMGVAVFVVLASNLSQLLFLHIAFDITYTSLVIVTYSLYQVIFKKDMIYNLKISGRGEILSNMREIYILTDEKYNVVDISPLLLERYDLSKEDYIGKNLDFLIETLNEKIVIYDDYDIDETESIDKDHYHLREKKFKLHGFKECGYMILLYDETQVYKLLRELNHLSYYDYMTGLHNRNYMENKLENLETSVNAGIVSLDLNGLKANNDYLGHDRGDYLLKQLAEKMKEVMHSIPDHFMARVGGDEFLIVVPNTDIETLKKIKKEMLGKCASEDIEKKISVAIGVAYSQEETSIYKVIREADENMYKMKQLISTEYSMAIVEYAKKTGKYIR